MVLLIGGHPRSGTTMLRLLCDRHPAMSVTFEVGSFLPANSSYRAQVSHVLKRFRHLRNRYSFSSSHNNALFVTRYVFTAYRFRRQHFDSRAVEAVLRSIYPRAKIVGDKWPNYVYRLDKLAGVDGLRLVIMYRDCRDVVSSTLEKVRTSWRGLPFAKQLDSPEKVATRWVRAIESMERHRERLHAIRYENLVQDPLVELERLGEWLNIDPWLFPFRVVRDTSVGKHTKALSRDELARVIDVAGATMRRLNYI
jgi:hypothetical protein